MEDLDGVEYSRERGDKSLVNTEPFTGDLQLGGRVGKDMVEGLMSFDL